MRITNKIMQRNNLANINTNKIYQDKLSTQMSTQKKINRPSDDPVVAIRALRLRSNVTEVTQYYSKNIPDAESWLAVTEDALKNLTGIVTNMISQCTKGSNGDLTSSDRQIILEQLKGLGEEVYSTGDADYAGRYVFTGYRTDTSLSFLKEENIKYEITEQIDNTAIDSLTKVNTGDLLGLTESNFADTTQDYSKITEQDVKAVEVYRIRLAYDDCSENQTPTIQFGKQVDANGNITFANSWTATKMNAHQDPYSFVADPQNENSVVYVPETGEVLLGKKRYDELMAVKDNIATLSNEAEIRVTYEKEHWPQGTLRPEHYFHCKSTDALSGDVITYNADYFTENAEKQSIEYDVGFNQTIRINSTADECFQHGIGREVDDLVESLQQVVDLETIQKKLQDWQKTADTTAIVYNNLTEADIVKNQLDAVGKALTLAKDKCQTAFENGITAFQGYLDDANLCITNCGTRSSKLELIENRMQNQKTTFETLKSENEDVDITDVAIQLTSAELTYEAALMATGKIVQTTLLNFI